MIHTVHTFDFIFWPRRQLFWIHRKSAIWHPSDGFILVFCNNLRYMHFSISRNNFGVLCPLKSIKSVEVILRIIVLSFIRRLAMRSDTCALIALSLNMTEHVQPVIWSLTQLPFDCNNILAVPKPIGEFVDRAYTYHSNLWNHDYLSWGK